MADIVVVLFVEGDTEVDFYKKLIEYLRTKNREPFYCTIEIKNVKGTGNYQKKVYRIFKNNIVSKYKNAIYRIVLCYDSDVFEFSRKPPVEWKKVITQLKNGGANEVKQIQAITSIEDWFLYDTEGLRSFLKLPRDFRMTGYKGQKGLEQLFRRANKTYIKGAGCNGLIAALHFDTILPVISKEIISLYAVLDMKPPPANLPTTA